MVERLPEGLREGKNEGQAGPAAAPAPTHSAVAGSVPRGSQHRTAGGPPSIPSTTEEISQGRRI
jgi:hypothetical protein